MLLLPQHVTDCGEPLNREKQIMCVRPLARAVAARGSRRRAGRGRDKARSTGAAAGQPAGVKSRVESRLRLLVALRPQGGASLSRL